MLLGTAGKTTSPECACLSPHLSFPCPSTQAAVKRHPHSGVVVYNACGAVLSIAQGFPDVQTVLQGDGSSRILRDAMERHGGIEEMYGTEVARLADWVAVNAKPKRDKPHLPGKTEYVTEKLYHEEYGLVPITPANERQLRGGPRYQSPNGTIRCALGLRGAGWPSLPALRRESA